MPASSKSAPDAFSYDWHASALGNPATWPAPLRQAADLMFNMPLPMLLAWGEQPIVLFNDAYAVLAGAAAGRAPGGAVPALLPAPFAAAGAAEALAAARRGNAVRLAGAAVDFGAGANAHFDLHFTPVRADGAPAGVLCALATAAASHPTEEHEASLAILVVEDNLDSQYLVCEMLKAFGYEADGVAHPDDALAHLAARHYHVLFTDVSLPGMSGVDLARLSLQRYPHLKVIFASGYGDMLLRHLDFPYQSLQKPYELDQLQDALATARGTSRAGA